MEPKQTFELIRKTAQTPFALSQEELEAIARMSPTDIRALVPELQEGHTLPRAGSAALHLAALLLNQETKASMDVMSNLAHLSPEDLSNRRDVSVVHRFHETKAEFCKLVSSLMGTIGDSIDPKTFISEKTAAHRKQIDQFRIQTITSESLNAGSGRPIDYGNPHMISLMQLSGSLTAQRKNIVEEIVGPVLSQVVKKIRTSPGAKKVLGS